MFYKLRPSRASALRCPSRGSRTPEIYYDEIHERGSPVPRRTLKVHGQFVELRAQRCVPSLRSSPPRVKPGKVNRRSRWLNIADSPILGSPFDAQDETTEMGSKVLLIFLDQGLFSDAAGLANGLVRRPVLRSLDISPIPISKGLSPTFF